MDDPFDQLHGVNGLNDVADVGIIDNDTVGSDNRPVGTTDPAVRTYSATTDASGDARVTVTVSMQPGNNYRAAASVLQDALVQNTMLDGQPVTPQQHADALSVTTNASGQVVKNGHFAGYDVPLVWSPMLTVWRKLHLEADSMSAESQVFNDRHPDDFEYEACVVQSIQADFPGLGFTTVQCEEEQGRAGYPGIDFHEGGAFWCEEGGPEWLIVRDSAAPYELILWGTVPTNLVGQSCTFRDDDLYFADSLAPRQLPRTSVVDDNIRGAYAQAYVDVVEIPSLQNVGNIVPWESHLSSTGLFAQHLTLTGVSLQWNIESEDNYWARHVVSCYQAARLESYDGDPLENCSVSANCPPGQVPPYPVLGFRSLPVTAPIFGRTLRYEILFDTAISTLYVETIRDDDISQTSLKFWQVVAHEVGHTTIGHDTGESTDDHLELGLMSGAPETGPLQNIPSDQRFTVRSLLRFRNVRRW